MKKFLGLLSLLLIMGCDDGDMTFDTFDFTDAAAQQCADGNILYKINGSEVLILEIDPANFTNVENREGVIIPIGTTNKVTYRNYSETVTSSSGIICTNIPPATPVVIEEWAAVGGSIKIVTTPLLDTETGLINGYAHQITLVSVDFSNADQNIIIQNNNFGTYNTTLGYTFDFTGTETNPILIVDCENSNTLIYKKNAAEVLIVDLPPSVFSTEIGTATFTLDDTDNRVVFDVYSASPGVDNICGSTIPPVTPVIEQRWNAEGEIVIETIFNNITNSYEYIITLNALFRNSSNGNETFEKLNYSYGTYIP